MVLQCHACGWIGSLDAQSRDIRSQAPPLFLCMLKKTGEPGDEAILFELHNKDFYRHDIGP